MTKRTAITITVALTLIGTPFACTYVFDYYAWRATMLQSKYSDHPLKYEKFGPSYYYRFTYSGAVGDEKIDIDQLVECRPYWASGGLGGGGSVYRHKLPEVTGWKLRGGDALYFLIPNFCYWRRGEPMPSPTDVVPLTFYTKDPAAIDETAEVEVYVSPDYYETRHARLKLPQSRITFLPREFVPPEKPREPFPVPTHWSGPGDERKIPPRTGWILLPFDHKVLDEVELQPVAKSKSGRFRMFSAPTDALSPYRGSGVRGRTSYIHYLGQIKAGRPLRRNGTVTLKLPTSIIPLRWGRDGYHAKTDITGVVFLQANRRAFTELAYHTRGSMTIDGDEIVLPQTEGAAHLVIYDQQAKIAYGIQQYW